MVQNITITRKLAIEFHLTCCKHGWSSSYCPTSSRPRGFFSLKSALANEPTSLLGVVGTVPWRTATLAKQGSVIPLQRTWRSSSARPRAARLARSFASLSSPCRERPCRPQSAPRAMRIGIRSTLAPQAGEISGGRVASVVRLLGSAALPPTQQEPLTPSLPSNQAKQAVRQHSSTASLGRCIV
jgi:hypothetical protein